MTSPKRAYFDPSGDRIYVGLDPKDRYVSVTSFLGILDKPFLPPWYAKVVAEISVEFMMDLYYGTPVAESIFGAFIGEDENGDEYVDWEDLVDWLKKSPTIERDAAGERGDIVHDTLEVLMSVSKGNPKIFAEYLENYKHNPEMSEDAYSRLEMFGKFLEENEVEVVETEATLYNDTLGYAGSIDLIAKVNGVLRFLDYKTSGTIDPKFALQVSAYAHCEYIVDELDKKRPMPEGLELAEGGILQLLPGRVKLIDIDISDEMFECVEACLLVKRLWVDDSKKKAIGKTLWDSKKKKSGSK